MAAMTVAVTLSLVFLTVEKYIRTLPRATETPQSAYNPAATTEQPGILLTVAPGLAGITEYPRTDVAAIGRDAPDTQNDVVSGLLRRPPEPAANVVLRAPVATLELVQLPLHATTSGIEYLMTAMDEAFEHPLHSISAQRPLRETPRLSVDSNRLADNRLSDLPSPASMTGRIPEPTSLLTELADLQNLVDPGMASRSGGSTYVMVQPTTNISVSSAGAINRWIVQTQSLLNQVVVQHGLEHPASEREIQQLSELADQAPELGNALTDYQLAARVIRVGYSLKRRVSVWQAIQSCLDGTTIALARPRSPEAARRDLIESIASVEQKIAATGAQQSWQKYLLLDQLKAWANSSSDIWTVGNDLSLKVLSRIHWRRLNKSQTQFLSQPEFQELAAHLVVWGRDPVDYRTLLTQLEETEDDPIRREASKLAGVVQVLRLSSEPKQKSIADAINTHYRNANIRLSVSGELIQRFLPSGEYEVRPVRQRILDADTRGNSAVHTQLAVRLIPDNTSWNIDIGVLGNLQSNTRSSKGPAVFHNSSTAQINSHRYIRLDPRGYQVSSQPTTVASQDYLRKMSTDFDGFPVIGDFARLIAREQFNQKRGLAQRIARRIIAQEADAELDRRLEESLKQAETAMQKRLVGPLENLNLNPMVVSMNTTEQRLTVRYRVANASQMAAHTPRPRAPTDSLMSMQFHQSAINNGIAQIGLSGKTWTLPQLYSRLAEVFQQSNWELPADVPQDITIRFADSRPATVEMEDGRLRLTLRIAELRQADRLHIRRFIVSSNYVPVADGLDAELLRDGVVEIVTDRRRSRDRLALRLIFAKVFVSRPRIPLISSVWKSDSRSKGLAVSQLAIRNGWLAVALSKAESQRAAEVAARARELKLR